MDLNLINSYFKQAGFICHATNKLIFFKDDFEVRIFANEKKILFINKNNLIYSTGLPKKEASVVKWVNLLISKYENENNKTDSEDY